MIDLAMGRFVHYTLATPNPDTVRRFYAHLFGWECEPDGSLSLEGRVFGQIAEGVPAPSWLGQVAVEDLEEALAVVEARGGSIRLGPVATPLGRCAHIVDPEGAPLVLIELEQEAPADEETSRSGAPCWNVLVSQQPTEALSFYVPLLGWSIEEVELRHELLGTYYVADRDGLAVAGIVQAIEKTLPPHWLMCVAVADIDATLEQARALGGQVARQPIRLPEIGAYAVITDPDGTRTAVLKWSQNRRPW